MATVESAQIGTPVDMVSIEIDYAIIQHFSDHLYSSPNKAIEELVANSFDAFATAAYVYIPGTFGEDRVLVWDDGTSMDVDGLKHLWWIARSPKNVGERVVTLGDHSRAMIGKFGIGKLASYAVGSGLAHLCRRDNRFLLVAVDYDKRPHRNENQGGEGATVANSNGDPNRYDTPILELTDEQARNYVRSLFRQEPAALTKLWDRESWTLAIIDNLREGVHLTPGRLAWILGNSMPLRPDFQVFLNDERVEAKLLRDAAKQWTLGTPEVQAAIRAAWSDASAAGHVEGEIEFGTTHFGDLRRPVVRLPAMGDVAADIRIFDESLVKDLGEEVRRHGFFVMVRGRLLNQEDDKLLLHYPSFGTFYRCQFVLYADGLDQDLLADRERLQRRTPRTGELGLLQQALYLLARQTLEERDRSKEQEERSESLLPVTSRDYFRDPIMALLGRRDGISTKPIDLAKPNIERANLGQAQPVADLDSDGGLKVNLQHPLFAILDKKLGDGRPARIAKQIFDVLAVSERLLEGKLIDLGLEDEQVQRIVKWRDGLLRLIADRFGAVPLDDLFREAREASYIGDKPFEDALVKLFQAMGFRAQRFGGAGVKDGLVVAPVGEAEFTFTMEAKGSKHPIENDKAEISGADAHRVDAKAEFAVVIAREFVGFKRSDDDNPPMVLKECLATGKVSIVTLDIIEALVEAVRDYFYPLASIRPILETIEPPAKKLVQVRRLQQPLRGFDFRGVLDRIWDQQGGASHGDWVGYRTIYHAGPNRWGERDIDAFSDRLVAMERITPLIRINTAKEIAMLLSPPDVVADSIRQAVSVRAYEDSPVNDAGPATPAPLPT